MHSFEHEQDRAGTEWRAGTMLPPGPAIESALSPEVEDARRRFLLAVRVMTTRKEREERDASSRREWMRTLEADVAAYKKWRWKKTRRQICMYSMVFLMLFGKHIPYMHWLGDNWWFFLIIGGSSAAAQAADRKRPQEMARLLATARDPQAVSVLAVAARSADPATKKIAEQGLRSIMPQFKASDAEHITEQGMEAILHLLSRASESDLRIAILRGLEQVGDERALDVIESLIRSERDTRLVDAARTCKSYVQGRVQQAQYRQTLLRPTVNPVAPDMTLLRPAGASETPLDQLLRPAE